VALGIAVTLGAGVTLDTGDGSDDDDVDDGADVTGTPALHADSVRPRLSMSGVALGDVMRTSRSGLLGLG